MLDRDGVINVGSPAHIKSLQEWQEISGSLAAIAQLNQAGYKVVICTNQSCIGKNIITLEMLNTIHQKLQDNLKAIGGYIDRFFICPHREEDQCLCRKPKPGLLLQVAEYYKVQLDRVYMIGDRIKDVLAAKAANAKPILVKSGEMTLKEELENYTIWKDVPVYQDLKSFVELLLSNE